MPRIPLLITAVVCLLLGLALGWLRLRAENTAVQVRPLISCEAPLTDHTGTTFRLADLRGRPALIYFGYTFCPDVCPTELGYMSRLLAALGSQGERIQPVFISVDPKRDTTASLAEYVPLFHPRLRGATGTPDQISVVASAFGAIYEVVQVAGTKTGHYLINHTSTIFLLDADGRLAGRIDSHMPIDEALHVLRKVL